jgi:flagellar basal-body rod modification protein FlgD
MNIMSVHPMSATSPADGSTGSSSASTGAELKPNDFITLLAAQLQSQDPFNPMDPTTFVNQLVQFNSLEQLIGIHQDLTPASSTGTGSTAGNASAAATPTTSK